MQLRSGKTISITNMFLEVREKILIHKGRVPRLNLKRSNKIISHTPFLNHTRSKYRLTAFAGGCR